MSLIVLWQRRRPEAAKKFIQIIDRLTDWVKKKGLFDNENQKKEVLTVIEEGRAVYENIVERARALGRE